MKHMLRHTLVAILITGCVFGVVTWTALESRDVALLHTQQPNGARRRTRVWIAEDAGAWWVEAATPQRPFYHDLLTVPQVELEYQGTRTRVLAVPLPNPEGHHQIRQLLRTKYGWADQWIGLLQDTSASIGIRLQAIAPGNSS